MTFDELKNFIAELNPSLNGHGTDFIIDCPNPKCRKRECQIKLSGKHAWNCFRKKHCGHSGNIFSLSNYGFDISRIDEARVFEEALEGIPMFNVVHKRESKTILPNLIKKEASQYISQRTYFQVQEMYVDPWNNDYQYVAVKENNQVVGFLGRSVTGREPKYNNKVDSGVYVYNIDALHSGVKVLFITEGAFSCHAVRHKLNVFNTDMEGIATFGANITEEHLRKIKERVSEDCVIYLLHESDVIRQVKKVIESISLHFPVYFAKLPTGRDPDDVSQTELLTCLSKPYSLADTTLEL